MVSVIRRRKRLFNGLLKAISMAIVFSLVTPFNSLRGFQLRLGDRLMKTASLAGDAARVKIRIGLAKLGGFADAISLDQMTVKKRQEPVIAFEIMSIRDFLANDILNPDYNTRTK